jgi:hypothetical protein
MWRRAEAEMPGKRDPQYLAGTGIQRQGPEAGRINQAIEVDEKAQRLACERPCQRTIRPEPEAAAGTIEGHIQRSPENGNGMKQRYSGPSGGDASRFVPP